MSPIDSHAIKIDQYSYPGFNGGKNGVCIWREFWGGPKGRPRGGMPVYVVTERTDNPGPSVTNCIENIAKQIAKERAGKHDFVLIEQYRPGEPDETFDLVTFDEGFKNPKWRATTPKEQGIAKSIKKLPI